jgi:hypothetical protein
VSDSLQQAKHSGWTRLRTRVTKLRDRLFPTPRSVLRQAYEVVALFEERYGRAARDDRKESMVAVFYALRALSNLPAVRTARERRSQIVTELVSLGKTHEEQAPGLGTILGWFQDTY